MRQVYYDITHLRHNARRDLISGIRRVDLEFARHFLGGRPAAEAIHYKLGGPALLKRDGLVEGLIADTQTRYAAAPGDHPSLPVPAPRRVRALPRFLPRDLLSYALYAPSPLGNHVGSIAPDAVYLNVAQHALAYRFLFTWLAARRDVRAVFLVHDLIPLDHPEFWRPGYQAGFRAGIATLAAFGAAFLVSTETVKARLAAEMRRHGRPDVPILALPFPDFRVGEPPAAAAPPADAPYFVMVGTIEPRKNHLLILNVWRRMAETGGPVPRLVIVGRRGWESEQVVDLLERCEAIRGHVVEIPSLSDAAMRRTVQGARALLMPSFEEGFGLPVAEALVDGTPVVASDIGVLREASQGKAIFCDPIDGPGWLATIRALSDPAHPLACEGRTRAAAYTPPDRHAYFAAVEAFLDTL